MIPDFGLFLRCLACSVVAHAFLLFICPVAPAARLGGEGARVDARLVVPVAERGAERLDPDPPPTELLADGTATPLSAPAVVQEGRDTPANDPPGAEPESLARQLLANERTPRYLPTRRLDSRPVVTKDVTPKSGVLGLSTGVAVKGGVALLMLWVNESGGVDRVDIESSDLEGDVAAALADDFKGVRFAPATSNGVATGFFMRIRVALEMPEDPLGGWLGEQREAMRVLEEGRR